MSVVIMMFADFYVSASTETTVTTTGGHTFHITGTTVGGKVVTTKLPLPANSKLITVNMATSQGGTLAFITSILRGRRRGEKSFFFFFFNGLCCGKIQAFHSLCCAHQHHCRRSFGVRPTTRPLSYLLTLAWVIIMCG